MSSLASVHALITWFVFLTQTLCLAKHFLPVRMEGLVPTRAAGDTAAHVFLGFTAQHARTRPTNAVPTLVIMPRLARSVVSSSWSVNLINDCCWCSCKLVFTTTTITTTTAMLLPAHLPVNYDQFNGIRVYALTAPNFFVLTFIGSSKQLQVCVRARLDRRRLWYQHQRLQPRSVRARFLYCECIYIHLHPIHFRLGCCLTPPAVGCCKWLHVFLRCWIYRHQLWREHWWL